MKLYHGESGRSLSSLGFYNLCASILDLVSHLCSFIITELHFGSGLNFQKAKG